ncbi:MAG: hypothetical protein J0L66_08915 [Cytophagales bacterium]|nr:hypothetical protein [Cytophagales bacterium]
MEKDYDEIISDILIQLASFELRSKREHERVESLTKRMDLTVKRMVKIESRMEELLKQLNSSINTQSKFEDEQTRLNKEFVDFINRNQSI